MRYVIKESPDPSEKNRYFDSPVNPIIGHALEHASRYYEVMDIEVVEHLSRGSPQDVRVLVRRIV